MMKPKVGKKPKHMGGAKPPAAPMAQPGKAGGAIGFKAPSSIKGFGHPVPEVKPLTTDRGSFKIK